jgi:hypothetical protein
MYKDAGFLNFPPISSIDAIHEKHANSEGGTPFGEI